jgi:hypothetical protein
MLLFFDLIYTKADQITKQDDSYDFLITLGATLFGFLLNEGYSQVKEYKRIRKVGEEFFLDVEFVVDTLRKQIASLEEDIPFIDPSNIIFTGRAIRVFQNLNTKDLTSVPKSDLLRYIRFKVKGKQARNAVIKDIFSTLSLINHEFERIQDCVNNALLKAGLQTNEYSLAISSLNRAFSDCLTEFERSGNDINNDTAMLELFKIIDPFLKDRNPNKGHTVIYSRFLRPVAHILALYRQDIKLIGMKEPLRTSFDSYNAIEKTYKELRDDLEIAQNRFLKYLADLEVTIAKFKKTKMIFLHKSWINKTSKSI